MASKKMDYYHKIPEKYPREYFVTFDRSESSNITYIFNIHNISMSNIEKKLASDHNYYDISLTLGRNKFSCYALYGPPYSLSTNQQCSTVAFTP